MNASPSRPSWVEIDPEAITANVATLCALVAPARVCAVVKADGYGHGGVRAAEAALAGGASMLAVATVDELVELRRAGVAARVLVLSEPPMAAMDTAVAAGAELTVYTATGIDAAARAGQQAAVPVPVHLKVDTGMHRVGAAPHDAIRLAQAIVADPHLDLVSTYTHCAVADEPENPYTGVQLRAFAQVLDQLRGEGIDPGTAHAGNSAVAIAHPEGRFDMVRCGIAIYGIPPSRALADHVELRPALALHTEVSMVKTVSAGEAISYGHHYRLEEDRVIATIPIGYADGLARRLAFTGGVALVRGREVPIAGAITMDQTLLDCGSPDPDQVHAGDQVVLIGQQGGRAITATDWADRLDTIAYEVVARLGPRLPRRVRSTG